MLIDSNKVSEDDIRSIEKENFKNATKKEKAKIMICSCSVPMFLVFVTSSLAAGILDKQNLKTTAIASFVIYILIFAFYKAKQILSLEKYNDWIKKISELLISSYKGVQHFEAYDQMLDKINNFEDDAYKQEKKNSEKIFFKTFFYICLVFMFFCGIYILIKDFVEQPTDLLNSSDLLFVSYLSLILSLVSFWKYFEDSKLKIETLDTQTISNQNQTETKKLENEIFIAFHNVCFQDPTKISDIPLINNLSFSVLPGEQITITGENAKTCGSYLFDLLLKNYKPQSGMIYLAGTKSDQIDKASIKDNIAIFKFDFCLIPGTVFENLDLAQPSNDSKRIFYVASNVGLLDGLDCPIYDEDGRFFINQETMIRIQIARIYMKKPKVVLIETPDYFENDIVQDLFEQFVANISKKKTTIMITDDVKKLVYSNKILYLGKDASYFGMPADLSRTKEYASYLKSLCEENEYEY